LKPNIASSSGAPGATLGAPSLIWQAAHGWPFQEIVAYHRAEGAIFNGSFFHFAMMEVKAMNVALAPLWLAGLLAPFLLGELRMARIISIASAVAIAAVFATQGKEYYLFPIFPSLFAAGAIAASRLNRWATGLWLTIAVAFSTLAAPLVLPVLSPQALFNYIVRGKIVIEPDEGASVGAPLMQMFSDELGWRELEAVVAKVYRKLPQAERSTTSIFAANYGEAAAIDFFGGADELPHATSGESEYFLWGPPPDATRNVIVVNGNADRWRERCRSVETAGEFGAPFVMPYENHRPIFICRDLRQPLSAIWQDLKYVHRKVASTAASDNQRETEGAAP
jgi:hypothetical protein